MRDALRHAVSRGGVGRTPGFILSLRLDSIGDEELLRGSKAEIKSAAAWRQSRRSGGGGSDLARVHAAGEELVQLDQLVGGDVEPERDAVERVVGSHLRGRGGGG